MTATEAPATITVICENCGDRHIGEYSHNSEFGGHAVYAVECTADLFTDWYTEAADITL